jgi:hypothetical protein
MPRAGGGADWGVVSMWGQLSVVLIARFLFVVAVQSEWIVRGGMVNKPFNLLFFLDILRLFWHCECRSLIRELKE